jgi:hypothetical protein
MADRFGVTIFLTQIIRHLIRGDLNTHHGFCDGIFNFALFEVVIVMILIIVKERKTTFCCYPFSLNNFENLYDFVIKYKINSKRIK